MISCGLDVDLEEKKRVYRIRQESRRPGGEDADTAGLEHEHCESLCSIIEDFDSKYIAYF